MRLLCSEIHHIVSIFDCRLIILGIRERELKRNFISIMQATYDSQGKIVVEEGNKELTTLNGDVLDEISYTHGDAPTPDQPGAWNVNIAHRVDLALLEQVRTLILSSDVNHPFANCRTVWYHFYYFLTQR